MPKGSKAKTKSELNLITIVLAVFFVLLSVMVIASGNPNDTLIRIENSIIKAEVAASDEAKAKGLSGRESLPENAGMLFVFNEPVEVGFWMKDMKFPLDFIWLDSSRQIVDIDTYVNPTTFPEVFYPSIPVTYVIEVNSGFVDANGLKLGDKAIFNL